MRETTFTNNFRKGLLEKFPHLWDLKIHGHEMQSKSIPDVLFCINGYFVAIEFKIQRHGKIATDPRQMQQLNKINNSKGIALLIAYDENIDRVMIRKKRIDYRKMMDGFSTKKRKIAIDWDFDFATIEEAVTFVGVMVEK